MDDDLVLVVGRHRLEAAKRLGMEFVECLVLDGTEAECRMWEIAENLHRADLTALERSEHIAEWVRLADVQAAHVAPAVLSNGRRAGPQHRPSGINAAARELGVDRTDAQRAAKVAGLSPEAKQAARDTGRDDNRAALLHAAKQVPEKQAEAIRTYEPVRSSVAPQQEQLRAALEDAAAAYIATQQQVGRPVTVEGLRSAVKGAVAAVRGPLPARGPRSPGLSPERKALMDAWSDWASAIREVAAPKAQMPDMMTVAPTLLPLALTEAHAAMANLKNWIDLLETAR